MATTTLLSRLSRATVALAACFAALAATPARAYNFETGDTSLQLRWDNTVKYSAAFRLEDRQSKLVSCPTCGNFDDGDRNFGKGTVSNRIDLLSELDVNKSFSTSSFGFRASAAAWYDAVYNRQNDNNSPRTSNARSVPNFEFTEDAKTIMGRHVEIGDLFTSSRFNLGSVPVTTRMGRHALLYGETLFFGVNGIAAAQQPIDAIKATSVPSSQFKELILPVWQISTIAQIAEKWAIGGYYQLNWRKTRLPASGSFLSANDFLGDGSERIFAGPPLTPTSGPRQFVRGLPTGRDVASQLNGKNQGQFGLQLRYTPEAYEAGLYFAQFHAKGPPLIYLVQSPNADPMGTGVLGTLVHVYPEDIRTVGTSLSTNLGPTNVAGEVSYRWNAPLVSDGQLIPLNKFADNSGHPAYAVGQTLHANVSATYLLTPTLLWEGGSVLSEIAWNMRTKVVENRAALDPNTTKAATALRFVFTPTYFQVLNGVDLNVPIGFGYNPWGRSAAVSGFNGGAQHGGDYSTGLGLVYRSVWFFDVNLVDRFGPRGPIVEAIPGKGMAPVLSFKQTLADRRFISINIRHTF